MSWWSFIEIDLPWVGGARRPAGARTAPKPVPVYVPTGMVPGLAVTVTLPSVFDPRSLTLSQGCWWKH